MRKECPKETLPSIRGPQKRSGCHTLSVTCDRLRRRHTWRLLDELDTKRYTGATNTGPRELFRKLFISESENDRSKLQAQLAERNSILDAVQGDAKSLSRKLDQQDQQKLEEYFSSVRDVEKQLELSRQWSTIAKPDPQMKEPQNTDFVSDLPVLYDLIALALQTDSTRIATFEIGGDFRSTAFGLRKDYHALSHHGQVQESIDA